MPFDGTQQHQILDEFTVERFKSWLRHGPFFVGKASIPSECPIASWLASETGKEILVTHREVGIGDQKYLPAPWMTAFTCFVDLGRQGKITRWRARRALHRLERHWQCYPLSHHMMQRRNP